MKTTYTISVVNTIDEQLAKAWQDLWHNAANATIFNSYEWFLTNKDIKQLTDISFYVCYKNDELVAILPMEKYKVFGIAIFGTINNDQLVDTSFLLKSYDKALIKTFFEKVFENKNVYLQKIDEKVIAILHDLFPNLLFSLISVNPTISLESDPFAEASESTITQIKRIVRKNEDKLTFKMYETDLEKHFDELLLLQKETSKNARAMNIFDDKETEAYYRNLARNCPDNVKISFIYYEGKPIAYEYGILVDGQYTGQQIAYHNDYRKLSPGKVMVYHLLQKLKELGAKKVDQGGGISQYKMSFTHHYRVLYNIYASPNLLVLSWWKAINTVRRLKQTVFPKKFTRDHEFLFRTFDKS